MAIANLQFDFFGKFGTMGYQLQFEHTKTITSSGTLSQLAKTESILVAAMNISHQQVDHRREILDKPKAVVEYCR